MSRKNDRRVYYHFAPRDVTTLPQEEIAAILRGADELIMQGDRTMLVKILMGD